MADPIAIFRHDGWRMDYTPGSDVAAGDVIDLGTYVGIATDAIASGTLGSLALYGAFDVNKYTGETPAVGDKMYWDAGTSTATKTVGYSEATMGTCIQAAAAGDARVRVLIFPNIS